MIENMNKSFAIEILEPVESESFSVPKGYSEIVESMTEISPTAINLENPN